VKLINAFRNVLRLAARTRLLYCKWMAKTVTICAGGQLQTTPMQNQVLSPLRQILPLISVMKLQAAASTPHCLQRPSFPFLLPNKAKAKESSQQDSALQGFSHTATLLQPPLPPLPQGLPPQRQHSKGSYHDGHGQ
jgi:hypothetical protein